MAFYHRLANEQKLISDLKDLNLGGAHYEVILYRLFEYGFSSRIGETINVELDEDVSYEFHFLTQEHEDEDEESKGADEKIEFLYLRMDVLEK